jgi:hypothetical protein
MKKPIPMPWVWVLVGMGIGMAENTHGLPVHFTIGERDYEWLEEESRRWEEAEISSYWEDNTF